MPADLLVTASGSQTPEEIRALGYLDSFGLLRDGTRLTVWADLRRYGGSRSRCGVPSGGSRRRE